MITLSNTEFIREVFSNAPKGAVPWVAGFSADPNKAGGTWHGGPVLNGKLPGFVKPEHNTFFAISTFREGKDGKYHRRKENFSACHLIMVDDVGTKIQPCQIPLEPSYKLETSPGNYQYGYLLAAPGLDGDLVARVIDAMIAQGLATDGKDPGMKGVTRYGRLPVGWNTKAKYVERLGAPFVHQLEEWHPEQRYSLQDIIEAFELDLDRVQGKASAQTDDPILKAIESRGLLKGPISGKEGVWDITCPWLDEHTDRADSGAAYFQPHFDGRDKPGYRCHHGHCENRTVKDLLRFLGLGARNDDPESQEGGRNSSSQGGESRLVVRRVADVETVPVEWLWKDRIALGKITFIVGDPDEGKSYLATALAASVTRGNAWPDGAPCERGSVILISAEDDIADTIKPRLQACGADLDKVHFIETVNSCKHGRKMQRLFSLQEDLDDLAKELQRLGDVRLVEIDPISAFLGECDSHVNAEVRGLMGPLAKLAAKHNTAFLGISHLNKGGEGNVLYRIMGSLAFVAVARGAFLLTHDKENPDRRLLLPIKNNLSGVRTGLAFSLVSNESGLPVLAWEKDAVNLTAAEALAPSLKENNETKLEAVKRWLKAELADAPAWGKTIEENAKGLGISIKTLKRAKGELDIKSKKQTFSGQWAWFLPIHSEVWPPSAEPAPDKPSPQEGHCPPSAESKRDADIKAAPDKDSSQEGHCPPSDEVSKNAPPGEGGQIPLGVWDNDYPEPVYESIQEKGGENKVCPRCSGEGCKWCIGEEI